MVFCRAAYNSAGAKQPRKNKHMNEDYYFFTCEISQLLCKTCILFKHLNSTYISFKTSVNLSAFLAQNK